MTKYDKTAEEEARLAAALRANLKKRKSQSKDREAEKKPEDVEGRNEPDKTE